MDITQRGGTHAAAARPGWGPTPRSGRSYSTAGRRDSPALTRLRVVAYVLTSVASLVFIIVAVYLGITVQQFQDGVVPAIGGLP